MTAWQIDLLTALDTLPCEQTVFSRIAVAARQLGFEHCAFGLRAPWPLQAPETVMLNSYSDAWCEHYQASGYLACDPTIRHGLRSTAPLVWRDEVFTDTPALWADAQAAGLCVGWAQSSLEPCGIGSLLTLVRSAEPLTDAELRAHEPRMRWLVQIAHLHLSRLLVPQLMADPVMPPLVQREIDILKWTGDGKTAEEIAGILKISVHTIHYYIKHSVEKLGAANKTAAVVRAMAMGLLR
jgi:LuxR family quorum-sensing system transcriptional regulator SolR